MNNSLLRDTRLFDALEYVDERFIAEVTDKYEPIGGPGQPNMPKRVRRIFYAKLAAAVACIMLLSGLVGRLPTILQNSGFTFPGWFGEDTTEQTETQALHVLTQDELDMINEYWRENFRGLAYAESIDDVMNDPVAHRYYGKFGECILIHLTTEISLQFTVSVENYRFRLSDGGVIVFHSSGKVYSGKKSLNEAYEDGALTLSDIASFNAYYGAFSPETLYVSEADRFCSTSFPINLPFEKISEICKAKYPYPAWINTDIIISMRCFGQYGDVYAVCVSTELTDTTKEVTETVNGSVFVHPSDTARLEIYKDGRFYSITDAFAEGLISEAALKNLETSYSVNKGSFPAKGPYHYQFENDEYHYIYYSHERNLTEYGCVRDYIENEIIVTIMPYAASDTYTAESFSEIGCIKAEEIADTDGMRKIKLTVSEGSSVVKLINKLVLRGDIYSAEVIPMS